MKHLVLALALVGCSKDTKQEAPPAKQLPTTTIDAAAPKPPAQLALVEVAAEHRRTISSATFVVIRADGTLTIGVLPGNVDAQVALAAVQGEPVNEALLAGQLDDLFRKHLEDATAADASPGDPCAGWGTIGVGRYGTIGHGAGFGGGYTTEAGIRGTPAPGPICAPDSTLVLADAAAPAARVIEVITALRNTMLAVAGADAAHVQALDVTFASDPGDVPGEDVEIGFTVTADGVNGSAYHGATADAATWTWSGPPVQLDEGYHDAITHDALAHAVARLRFAPDAPASALIAAVVELTEGHASTIGLGEPRAQQHRNALEHGASSPTVQVGQPEGDAGMDKAIIRRYVKRNLPKVTYCYEKEMLAEPTLEGTVTASWTILPTGVVEDAKASGIDDAVSSCIARVLGEIEFPKPASGAKVTITSYPFTFHPPEKSP